MFIFSQYAPFLKIYINITNVGVVILLMFNQNLLCFIYLIKHSKTVILWNIITI